MKVYKNEIKDRIAGYASPVDFYVDKIAEGVATLAASVYPKKSNRAYVRFQVK